MQSLATTRGLPSGGPRPVLRFRPVSGPPQVVLTAHPFQAWINFAEQDAT